MCVCVCVYVLYYISNGIDIHYNPLSKTEVYVIFLIALQHKKCYSKIGLFIEEVYVVKYKYVYKYRNILLYIKTYDHV